MAEFVSKLKGFLDKSVEVSKDALSKAGEKVQTTADHSVKKIEIAQFESKIKKEITEIGNIVFNQFDTDENADFSAIKPQIQEKIANIHNFQGEIEQRKEEIQAK
ncbi:MAG: hypothetical protein ACRC4W_08855 [Treponemataceae bacterium]